MATEQLGNLTRDELNERATALGIDAASLPTKQAVIDAIEAQASAGPAAGDRSPHARRARMLRQRRARGQL
jgi:hypothetical protein